MRYLFLGLALAGLVGCSGPEHDRRMACRAAAGPRPNATLDMFGLIGALAQAAQPDTQAWEKRVDDCINNPPAKVATDG